MRLALAQLVSTPDRDENRRRCLDAVDTAADRGAAIVAFPEVVLDRFFPAQPAARVCGRPAAAALAETVPGPTVELLQAKARERGIVVVFNLYEVDGDRYFDASPVIDADGSLLGVTRMLHICDYPGFHEQDYYHPGDRGAPVYATRAGKVGVAICYDRHYPEVPRALAAAGAELIVIPQAGTVGEWPEGLYEAEVRTAAFQNGVFAALCNRVGVEETLVFAGESFVVDPDGRVIARGAKLEEDLVVVDLDLAAIPASHGKRLFWRDRRPELYAAWTAG